MSRHRGTIAAATLVFVLSSVPGVAIAEEVDGVCDLEISINRAPTLVDNVVDRGVHGPSGSSRSGGDSRRRAVAC